MLETTVPHATKVSRAKWTNRTIWSLYSRWVEPSLWRFGIVALMAGLVTGE